MDPALLDHLFPFEQSIELHRVYGYDNKEKKPSGMCKLEDGSKVQISKCPKNHVKLLKK